MQAAAHIANEASVGDHRSCKKVVSSRRSRRLSASSLSVAPAERRSKSPISASLRLLLNLIHSLLKNFLHLGGVIDIAHILIKLCYLRRECTEHVLICL
jgi:hypothetical protein